MILVSNNDTINLSCSLIIDSDSECEGVVKIVKQASNL